VESGVGRSVGLFLVGIWGAVFCAWAAAAEPEPSGFGVSRGTNISHWLSQSSRRGEERRAFFTERDVAFLAELGFDHIRIPVDEEQLWDGDGVPDEESFSLLQSALDWCDLHNLSVVVDLHILRSHHFNHAEKPLWTDPAAQDRLRDCWRDLSDRLASRPLDKVAYELMNEPVADDAEDWNRLLARIIGFIREREPRRTLVIGSNRWQSVHTFDRLRVPDGDPNILLSFHFYTPMALTHYRASWNKVGEYTGPVRYPGNVVEDADTEGLPLDLSRALESSNRHFDRDALEELLAKPLALARETGLSLYCGEWGSLKTPPEEDRLRWYADVRAILEKHGIGWATWDYKGAFGIVDRRGKVDERLIQVLTVAD
jgi:endoglucanase